MQIVIDTQHDGPEQIRGAIRMLQAYLADPIVDDPTLEQLLDGPSTRMTTTGKADVVELFKKPTETPRSAPATLADAPPPPPPLMNSSPATGLSDAPPPPSTSLTATGTPMPGSSRPPQTSAQTQPPEYDSAGVPFDERIHQKKRGKKTDGSWKLQKGIDPAVVQSVISELSASGKMQALGSTSTAAAPMTSSAPSPAAGVFGKSPLPASAPVDAPPPPPPSDAMPTTTFRALVAKCAAATKAGKMTPQEVQQVCQQHGAPTLMSLNTMAHLIPDVEASFDAALLMKG